MFAFGLATSQSAVVRVTVSQAPPAVVVENEIGRRVVEYTLVAATPALDKYAIDGPIESGTHTGTKAVYDFPKVTVVDVVNAPL